MPPVPEPSLTRRTVALLAVLTGLLLLAACGSEGAEPVTLQVYVDSRLEAPVTELVEAFEPDNPAIDLELVIGTTDELADRIRGGDPADILVGLRDELAQLKAEEILRGDVLPLGSDVFGIVVPEGNPAGVLDLTAFTPGGTVRTAICAEGTRCFVSASQVLAAVAIPAEEVPQIPPIELLFQVASRDLDATLGWTTQASAISDDFELVRLAPDLEQRLDYTIAAVEDTATIERTVSWFATNEASTEVLRDRGLRDWGTGSSR